MSEKIVQLNEPQGASQGVGAGQRKGAPQRAAGGRAEKPAQRLGMYAMTSSHYGRNLITTSKDIPLKALNLKEISFVVAGGKAFPSPPQLPVREMVISY